METPACPLCAGPAGPAFMKYGYRILECRRCSHRFCGHKPGADHVQAVYGDGYFHGGGAGYPDYLAKGKLLRELGARYARMIAKHAPPGRVLDVGCAAGFLLRGFVDGGWNGKGVEPNAGMAAYGRVQLGLDLVSMPFEDYPAGERFDLVTLIQVLPHFADPAAAMKKAAGLLHEGGLLLVETWDRKSLTARMFGKNWHEYSPPSVLHWFSRGGLESLAAAHGLAKVAAGRPLKWLDGAHAKSIFTYASGALGKIAKPVLDRVVRDGARIPYPSEDVFWMLFRK